jgi:hypothetical protein
MKKSPKKAKTSPSTGRNARADQLTILEDVAHIPDRDQEFSVEGSSKSVAPHLADVWAGDLEQRVIGDRDLGLDAVDELRRVERITRSDGLEDIVASRAPMVSGGHEEMDLRDLSDAELLKQADALGIPDRATMNHHRLLAAVRSARHI